MGRTVAMCMTLLEHDFTISWNLKNDIWEIAAESVEEVGRIHTC